MDTNPRFIHSCHLRHGTTQAEQSKSSAEEMFVAPRGAARAWLALFILCTSSCTCDLALNLTTGSAPTGRRLRKWVGQSSRNRKRVEPRDWTQPSEAVSSTQPSKVAFSGRVTRGLGLFSGEDFPCDSDRDAFVGASWSKGACLMQCSSSSTGVRPSCDNALSVCSRLPRCTTVDINVEGSVATLKAETPLSRRTSRVKDIDVRQLRSGILGLSPHPRDALFPRGSDASCTKHEVELPELPKASCVLNCPQLNCTAGIGMCYELETCVGVDISLQGPMGAVARLRFASSVAEAKAFTTRS